MSASRSSSGKTLTLHLPAHSLKIAGIAFGVGLLLFVAVWASNRKKDFYTAGPTPTPQQVAEVEPLPEPLAAAAGSSDMPDAKDLPAEAEKPQLVEPAPPPPAQWWIAPPSARSRVIPSHCRPQCPPPPPSPPPASPRC